MKAFFDTNIFVYEYGTIESGKHEIAGSLLKEYRGTTSTQVLSELSNVLSRKFHTNWSTIDAAIHQVMGAMDIYIVSPSTIRTAIQLAERDNYSYYDNLILAAAIESGCQLLFSEDFQHNHTIDGLTIMNPFK